MTLPPARPPPSPGVRSGERGESVPLLSSGARDRRKRWCGRGDSNPQEPLGPTDFHAVYGFRRRHLAFAVWTIP